MMTEGKWSDTLQAKIIARAWKDEEFKKNLIEKPKETLKEYGLSWKSDVNISTVEENPEHLYFILPQSPAQASKLSEEELEKLAAAHCYTGTNKCSITCLT